MNYSKPNTKIPWLWLTVAFGSCSYLGFVLIACPFGAIALGLLLSWISALMPKVISSITSRCLSMMIFKGPIPALMLFSLYALQVFILFGGFRHERWFWFLNGSGPVIIAWAIVFSLVAALALSKASKILSNRFSQVKIFGILTGTSGVAILVWPHLAKIIWCLGDRCTPEPLNYINI
ncbi:MAG: hypothetical protein AB4352_22300 [Hormoscilla sp.]